MFSRGADFFYTATDTAPSLLLYPHLPLPAHPHQSDRGDGGVAFREIQPRGARRLKYWAQPAMLRAQGCSFRDVSESGGLDPEDYS